MSYEILGVFFAQLELRKGQTAMLMAANNDLPVVAKTLIMGNADVNQAKRATHLRWRNGGWKNRP